MIKKNNLKALISFITILSLLLSLTIPAFATGTSASLLLITPVGQQPDVNICWAACDASMINYMKITNHTAKDIAITYYGSNYNQEIQPYDNINKVLPSYHLPIAYGYNLTSPSPDVILKTLTLNYGGVNGYTICATYAPVSGGDKHICLITAINTITHTFTIMDPWDASFKTFTYTDNTYSFKESNGATYQCVAYGGPPLN